VWFGQLTRDGVFFVTRMKTNTVYTTVEVCAVREKGNVLSDQIISVPSLSKNGEAPVRFGESSTGTRTSKKFLSSSPTCSTWQPRRWPRSIKTAGKSNCFQGTEANSKSEVVPGHQRQCSQDADMDGINRHADPEILQMKSSFGWSLFQSGRSPAPTAIHLQRLVGMAQHSSGGTASRKATLRTIPMPLMW